jgi:hypothetical protein
LANSVAGGGKGAIAPNNSDLRVRQRQSTTVRLPGYGGAATNTGTVQTFLSGRNTLTTVAAAVNSPPGGGFIGGAGCTAPSFALAKPETTNQRDYFAQSKPTLKSESTNGTLTSTNSRTKQAISQTLSHHAKLTRPGIVTAINKPADTARNTAVNSTVTTPAAGQEPSRRDCEAGYTC